MQVTKIRNIIKRELLFRIAHSMLPEIFRPLKIVFYTSLLINMLRLAKEPLRSILNGVGVSFNAIRPR